MKKVMDDMKDIIWHCIHSGALGHWMDHATVARITPKFIVYDLTSDQPAST
jgi:hypothetical protein